MSKDKQTQIIEDIDNKGNQLNQLKAQGQGESAQANQLRAELKQLTEDYTAEES